MSGAFSIAWTNLLAIANGLTAQRAIQAFAAFSVAQSSPPIHAQELCGLSHFQ